MCGELNPFFSIFQAKFLKKYQKNRLRGVCTTFSDFILAKLHKIETLLWIDINNFQERGPTTNSDLFFSIV
jgi:hypothetical protein